MHNAFGRLDVLINNAGIISEGEAAALKVGLPTVRATLETNALAPLQLAQALAPLLRRGAAPRIINMSSGMGALANNDGGYAAYRISKTALNAVTVILAAELRGAVAVNAVCPGWVRTDMGGRHADRDVADGRTPPSGSRSTRRRRLPANSCATAKSFRGELAVPWPTALNGAAAQD